MLTIQAILVLIVILFALDCDAQFRIVGLLNDRPVKINTNVTATPLHRSNAQGRGFSVVDSAKRSGIRPNSIIRVHIIDDDSDSVFPTNGALFKHKKKFNEATASKFNKTGIVLYKTHSFPHIYGNSISVHPIFRRRILP